LGVFENNENKSENQIIQLIPLTPSLAKRRGKRSHPSFWREGPRVS